MKINRFPAHFSDDVLKRCETALSKLGIGEIFIKDNKCYIKTDKRGETSLNVSECINLETGYTESINLDEFVYVMCYNFEFTGIKVLNA